jgi:hypothetical protein
MLTASDCAARATSALGLRAEMADMLHRVRKSLRTKHVRLISVTTNEQSCLVPN